MNARLLTEELVQVLNKADDNDDGRAGQPDEKEKRQQMHSEIDRVRSHEHSTANVLNFEKT